MNPSVHFPPSVPASYDPAALLTRQRLERLSASDLDRLAERWMESLGFRSVRLWERRGFLSTYEAVLGPPRHCVSVRLRVHQHLKRLEITHVESFLGHLVRAGSPLGILVATGEVSFGAELGARTRQAPRLRLLGGSEWAGEIMRAGLAGRGASSPPDGPEARRSVTADPPKETLPAPGFPKANPEEPGRTWQGCYRIW